MQARGGHHPGAPACSLPHTRPHTCARTASPQPVDIDGDLYVDGGVLRNLPVDAFARGLAPGRVLAFLLGTRPGRKNVTTLTGFTLQLLDAVMWGEDSANSIKPRAPTADHGPGAWPREIAALHVAATRLFDSLTGPGHGAGPGPGSGPAWSRPPELSVVSIDAEGVGPADFGLNRSTKLKLVAAGHAAMSAEICRCGHASQAMGDCSAASDTAPPPWLAALHEAPEADAGGPAWLQALQERWRAQVDRLRSASP